MGCVQGYGESSGTLDFSCGKECSPARTYPGIEIWTMPFYSPTLVLLLCTIFLPSLWLVCIYLLVLLSGVGRAISRIFYLETTH